MAVLSRDAILKAIEEKYDFTLKKLTIDISKSYHTIQRM